MIAATFFLALAIAGRIEWRGGRIVSATRWGRVLSGLVGVAFLAASAIWALYLVRQPCPACPPCPDCPPCPTSCPPVTVTVNLSEPTTGPIHEKEFQVPLPFQIAEEMVTPEEFDQYAGIWADLTFEQETSLILKSLKEDTPIWVGPDLSPMFWGDVSKAERDSFEELLMGSGVGFVVTMAPETCPE